MTLEQNRGRVFGVRLVDEEACTAREVEWVSAARIVGCDQGLNSRRHEHRLRELCVASRGECRNLNHRKSRCHLRLPESERVRFGAGVEEGDFQCPLTDRVVLAHELVEAAVVEQAAAVLVDVHAV